MRIENTTAMLTPGNVATHVDIHIHGTQITAVTLHATSSDSRDAGEAVIDGQHRLYLPGMIDAHLHTGQQLLASRVLDAKPIIWTRIMLPFESQMTPEVMRLSAEIAALSMIQGGTTGFVESGSYFMHEAGDVYAQSGLRGALSMSTMDDPTLPASIRMTAQTALAKSDELYDAFDHQGNLQVYYALRALNNCSDALIQGAAEHASDRGTMLQAHMNEYPAEVDGIVARAKCRPYEFLNQLGALSDHFLGSHSLFLSEHEQALIAKSHAIISHSPFSNAGKGVPNTPALLKAGIPVALGTDGAAHGGLSLFNEIKIFRSVMNLWHGVPNHQPAIMPAATILKMVFNGGAQALHAANQIGKIAPGYQADLIAIDLDQPHLWPSGNWTNTVLEDVNASDVCDTMVAGRWLMRNREVLTLDVERIRADFNRIYPTLFK